MKATEKQKAYMKEFYQRTFEQRRPYRKKYYQEHKEQRRLYNKRYYQLYLKGTPHSSRNRDAGARFRDKLKREVLLHYSNNEFPKCQRCGFDDIRALSIDHIGGDGRAHRGQVGGKGKKFYTWLRKNNYPKGYQTLCMNCQWIKRFENKEHNKWPRNSV